MKIQEKIAVATGITKRLFMAYSDFRGEPPQLEDALYQLASVIDSTSKKYFPNAGPGERFKRYVEDVTPDIFRIALPRGISLVKPAFGLTGKEPQTFAQILWDIRCSSYHDPEEVEALIHWGSDTQIGSHKGKFVINKKLLIALFLVLISDRKNKDFIDLELFNDEHWLEVDGAKHPFSRFVGSRSEVYSVLGIRVHRSEKGR